MKKEKKYESENGGRACCCLHNLLSTAFLSSAQIQDTVKVKVSPLKRNMFCCDEKLFLQIFTLWQTGWWVSERSKVGQIRLVDTSSLFHYCTSSH